MASQFESGIAAELFAGNGEMAGRMRALDWWSTPLGPVESWPQSLKTCVSICLHSRFAIRICWGPELVMLYNDAYIASVACGKHPAALGARARDVWPEIWETIGPLLQHAMDTGEATWADDLLLLMERNGYIEECYFTFSYGPIREESGSVGGVFTPVLETTERVIGARRMKTLRDLATISGAKTVQEACAAAIGVLSENSLDVPFAVTYVFDGARRDCATLAAATVEGSPVAIDLNQELWQPYRRVMEGEICIADAAVSAAFFLPEVSWGAPLVETVAVPIAQPGAVSPIGFLLAGVSPRKRLDADYRNFFLHVAAEAADVIREAEAFERERRLRADAESARATIQELFLHAPAAVAVLNSPQHRYTLVNEAYVRMVGRNHPEDLIGRTVADVFPELRDQGIVEILDDVYRTGVPFIGNELLMKLDQTGNGELEDFFFNFAYQAVRDVQGQIEGIFVLATEATEQVLARREIETREEQFRVLANSIPQMAWMANADGFITWYNDRWYEYTGATQEQMKGSGTEFVHPESLRKVLARYNRSMATGEPFDMVFPLRRADGKFHSFLSRALPVRDSSGKIVRWFGTNTDVEAQQRAELALRESEKLAAVGRLASSIAHEINNPLEGVTNLIYLARLTAENPETRRYLASAEDEMGRVSQIVNQTLRFHKQQSAATATDMADLLESILTLYRGKLSRDGVELKLEMAACPPLVCYAGEIRQVLANLVGNALDAMPRGGTLWMRMRPGTEWRSGMPGIRFTVGDTGHGMAAETRKHIYEPFFTTKGETGTGLGLWVTKGIIEKHGAGMHVRSSVIPEKSWTIFSVTVPFTASN